MEDEDQPDVGEFGQALQSVMRIVDAAIEIGTVEDQGAHGRGTESGLPRRAILGPETGLEGTDGSPIG